MSKFIPLTNEGTTFEIAETAVTFDEYDAFCKDTGRAKPGDSGWGRGTRPVINVAYHDAIAFCEWMTKQDPAHHYRLPTEEEWEFAARGGAEDASSNEGQLDEYAWSVYNADAKTHPVGEKKPNNYGLYDMYGNVWEWTSSTWNDDE